MRHNKVLQERVAVIGTITRLSERSLGKKYAFLMLRSRLRVSVLSLAINTSLLGNVNLKTPFYVIKHPRGSP
jgi:hypothetical protein